jgi:putative hemolysin
MFDLTIIFLLILINGFFALIEAAFISSRNSLLATYLNQGKKNAAFLIQMRKDPEAFLSSIQVCITLIGIISGAYGGITLSGDFAGVLVHILPFSRDLVKDISLALIVIAITYFSIVLGELTPKTIAMKNPERIALLFAPVIRIVMAVFKPLISVFSLSTKFILFITGFRNKAGPNDPVREIVSMIRMASLNEELDKDQERIILNTINLTKIALRDIMIARSDIKFLDSGLSIVDAFLKVHVYHHTRYPVVKDGNLDKVVGYTNFKDIVNVLKINPKATSLVDISRPIMKFGVRTKIFDVLRKLINNGQHISVITDKKGNTEGLLTLEDIIEFILGDIYDEHDLPPEYLYSIAKNHFVAGGGVRMEKLAERLHVRFDDGKKILSDWLIEKTGNKFSIGQTVEIGNCLFTIKKSKSGRVFETTVEVLSQPSN